jgi:ureidoglycolate lyase
MIELRPDPLTAEAFRPFGDVIEARDAYELINSGTTQKFADLAKIDVSAEGGRPCVSIYRTTPYPSPLAIKILERHPLGTQLFMPLNRDPFLIVVAPIGDRVPPTSVRAFITNGRQGINYQRGTWHHALVAVERQTEFLVIDRVGQGRNCEELALRGEQLVLHFPAVKSAPSAAN